MDPQQMQVLRALETDLQAALETAKSTQQDALKRMVASRELVTTLFANEAVETALYVEDTQLQMRAIRDVVQLEMESTRRQVEQLLANAKRDAATARAERDRRREEIQLKTAALLEVGRRRELERIEELSSAKREAETEAARLLNSVPETTVYGRSHRVFGAEQANNTTDSARTFQVSAVNALTESGWVLPFLASLVMCSCLWVVISIFQHKRRTAAEERHHRVVYSAQLKTDAVNAVTQSPEAKSVDLHTRTPTLRRRLRPGWSPAASTASTVSSPDTSSIFSSPERFEVSTPSPFG